jgi:hypothetical protein
MYILNAYYNLSDRFKYKEIYLTGRKYSDLIRVLFKTLYSLRNITKTNNILIVPNRSVSPEFYSDIIKHFPDNIQFTYLIDRSNWRSDIVYIDIFKLLARMIGKLCAKMLSPFLSGHKKRVIKASSISSVLWLSTLIEGFILMNFFKMLFTIIKPKRVFAISWYQHYPAIIAARQLNIESYDVQHGVIHKEHYGYNYGCLDSMMLPSKFLLLGKYWERFININQPYKLEVIGNSYLSNAKNNDKMIPSKRILIISQYSIRHQIKNEIIQKMKHFDGFELLYKLHPKERDEQYYTDLIAAADMNGVDLSIIGSQSSIRSLYPLCDKQIGVFSTSIYEGLEYGMCTLILKIAGWQNIMDIINGNSVILDNSFADMESFLENKKVNTGYKYFESSCLGSIAL